MIAAIRRSERRERVRRQSLSSRCVSRPSPSESNALHFVAKASTTGLLNWWSGSALTSLLGPGDDAYVSAYAYAILVSAYAFAKAVSSPYVGDLSDRFGRRRVLVATLVCTGLALLLCGRAERFATVLVVRLLTGCVANGGLLTARATAQDVVKRAKRRVRCACVVAAAMVRLAHLGWSNGTWPRGQT